MGCIGPATPGFLITLIAAALLGLVSFCVPYFEPIFFLKASIPVVGTDLSGSITFGTLGYCLKFPNETTFCSEPQVGYKLDVNQLLDNNLPFEIPSEVVKWITYVLVLHLVAFALATLSASFGLLAHIQEIPLVCCSTLISGFAATVAMLAFIFDIVLFALTKKRIDKTPGGKAEMGIAIWLTLVGFMMLFFSGCFYMFGRCCISSSGGGRRDPEKGRY
ncbi:pali-domain-containing protein [Pleurotus eryngii]|uniref:Pali-domain-containing protein n=1 Tax=Pleurotus eryngii TaxID=5323 RepID=A0A9P6AA82_PLEER|nr:pali-domain-containing protein [Pleurotus eryngii]